MFKTFALLLALCLTLCSTPMVSAAEPADSATTTAQVSNQSVETMSTVSSEDCAIVHDWNDLMEYMDTIPLPLSTRDEVVIYKLIYYLDEHFVDGNQSHLTMPLPGDEIVNPDLLMLAITRVVRLFNDDPAHYWFVEWDPVYEENGDIAIHVYISMDRQKYPATYMGLSKILPGARFYASAWGGGSGLYDTFSADEWFYNEPCFVIVLGVAFLDEEGRVIQTDFVPADRDPICPVTHIDTSGPGNQRYLLIGTFVDHELIVLGFTNSGNVRSIWNVNN